MTNLLSPIKIGALELPNRLVMGPLTRTRAIDRRIPNDLMREYYVQRASAGLLITEGTSISPMGVGYPNTPGLWSREQVVEWRKITDAVHDAGGRIVVQSWHVGRVSDPIYLDGELPIAPSAIAANGHVSHVRPQRPYPVPRALETGEIPGIIEQFRVAAQNALEAGFDGVELHGANGYLLEEFLYDGTNRRTDEYGGPVENRARVMLEAVDATISVWGAERVGIQLSPRHEHSSANDSDPLATFGYVFRELSRRNLAFILAREPQTEPRIGQQLRPLFSGAYIANEGLTPEVGEELLMKGEADAIAFGRLFISNPDLAERIAKGAPLNEWDASTFYTSGAEGYTDYPSLQSASL